MTICNGSGVPFLRGIFSPLPLDTLFQGTRGRGSHMGYKIELGLGLSLIEQK